jgi:hypothetical protein
MTIPPDYGSEHGYAGPEPRSEPLKDSTPPPSENRRFGYGLLAGLLLAILAVVLLLLLL